MPLLVISSLSRRFLWHELSTNLNLTGGRQTHCLFDFRTDPRWNNLMNTSVIALIPFRSPSNARPGLLQQPADRTGRFGHFRNLMVKHSGAIACIDVIPVSLVPRINAIIFFCR